MWRPNIRNIIPIIIIGLSITNANPKVISINFRNEGLIHASPPDHDKVIAMARYVVHQAGWASVATISTLETIEGYPFTNVVSMSDGPVENSTGIPYFYLTPLDFTSRDLEKDKRVTISVTLEETDYCRIQNIDPEDPRCARVMISGTIEKVAVDSAEHQFAENALFSRHPSMKTLPKDHGFYVATLKINQIAMLDWFGGPKYIKIQEYLNFNPDTMQSQIKHNRMNYGAVQI